MIGNSILNITDDDLVEILLYGNCKFSLEINSSMIKASIICIESSERLDKSFFELRKTFTT